MPIYEYECVKCKERTEVLIRNDKDVPVKCGTCGGKLNKALSGFSVSMAPSGSGHQPSAACAGCPSGGGCPHARG